jgi:acyl-CoA thioester hydrolase
MLESVSLIKIRYDEVDKMGYVYHGNYAKYYHISRTDLLRKIDICDKTLEKINIILPVIEMNIRYLKPVFYDETIKIITTLTKAGPIRWQFSHKVFNPADELVNKATSTIVFVDIETRKPRRIPQEILARVN